MRTWKELLMNSMLPTIGNARARQVVGHLHTFDVGWSLETDTIGRGANGGIGRTKVPYYIAA